MNLTDTLTHIGKGASGIVASQVATSIDPTQTASIVHTIVQVIIGLVTLWGLLKKKKTV